MGVLNDDINRYLGTISYPFTSIDFLFEDMLQQYYDIEYPAVKDKTHIRESLINYMTSRYSIYSYDEIYLYLDKWYFYPEYDGKEKLIKKNSFDEIWKHLEDFSKCFISQRDGKIIYKYWKNDKDDEKLGGFSNGNKIYLFHSLNRLIPLDILVSIYMVKNGKTQNELNGYYGNISVSDVLLDQVLEQGVAENHLHSGVSASFLTVWDDLMKPLNEQNILKLKNLNIFNEFGMDKNSLLFLMLSANLLRFYLLLVVKEVVIHNKSNLLAFPINFGDKEQFSKQISFFINAENENKTIEKYFLDQWEKIKNEFDCDECDIRSVLEVQSQLHTSDESLFLHNIISYVYNNRYMNDNACNYIKKSLMNYLRIKNYFYQLLVQQKSIHGLNYFQNKYYRNSSTFNSLGNTIDARDKWERIIREQLQNENLKKLELRTSIRENEKDQKKDIVGFLTSYRKILRESYCQHIVTATGVSYRPIRPFPKIGIVFHLLKNEQDYLPEKCIKKSDDINYLQYGKVYESYKKQIELFLQLRNQIHGFNKNKYLDKYLLGIDVASLENAVPTWVFTSIFENARDSRIEPINRMTQLKENYQSLGFTFHAGEDFRHILSGLRRIDEVVKFLKFHSGDRIGHGIALGISIDAWHKLNSTIIIPRIEALENYIWAYNLLSSYCNDSLLVNLSYIEKKIYDLSKEIYGTNSQPTINILIDAYIGLFEENFFEKMQKYACICCGTKGSRTENHHNLCGYFTKDDNSQDKLVWNVEMLKTARHCKKYIYKMNEPIHMYVPDQEIEIAKEVQKLVKQNVYKKGIIIEINPSSNVTISAIDTLAESQVYGLSNYGFQFDDLMVCINSDDPAVFNTNVLNEMGYIYFGMLEKGLGREAILNWLEKLRKDGMSASFLRRKDSDIQILNELDELLDEM